MTRYPHLLDGIACAFDMHVDMQANKSRALPAVLSIATRFLSVMATKSVG